MEIVIKKKKLVDNPIDLLQIERFLYSLSSMDSNNYPIKSSIGEREGRCFSNLVAKRNYYFTHGIGRSGDLNESQPKAPGSSLLYKITNLLINEFMEISGFDGIHSILVPLSPQLTLLNCLLTFNSIGNVKKVLYNGVDKQCYDFVEKMGFELILIDSKDDLESVDKPLCVLIDYESINLLNKIKNLVPIIVVNAECGIFKDFKIENPHLIIFKDNNLIIPPEASILCSYDIKLIEKFSKMYPGRATITSTISVFIALLSKGKIGLITKNNPTNFFEKDDFYGLIPDLFLKKGFDGLNTRKNMFKNLLIHKKIPENSWNINLIQHFLSEIENDSLQLITTNLIDDLFKIMGIQHKFNSIILPVATGMSLTLTFLTCHKLKPKAKYILWSRIDQKSCFKAINTAGLVPIIIDTTKINNNFVTNLNLLEEKIIEIGTHNIVCIASTTSCFAPRNCDDIESISIICKKYDLFHIVNNAYGLGSKILMKRINRGKLKGNIDVFVQSTDKNLLIPVGGSILVSFNPNFHNTIKCISQKTPPFLIQDIFITLMEMGKKGFLNLIDNREIMYNYLKEKLINLALKHGEEVCDTSNLISIAMTLTTINSKDRVRLGSSLFLKNVFGAKVVTSDVKIICGFKFQGWGSHSNECNFPYIACAAGLGVTQQDIDGFVTKLDKEMLLLKQNNK
nr:O-phosphoseryl-tRNA(Sec) selenium transferase [Onthophagus taurus]XP_022904184.1 O-phosphoseryl-tRNA(Sec) selenium transferase [Onthophagus taurus]XP_022904185.1 O-phosphoseryl-tRNA(Sec) selenium transferase [Onthophagus taurus]